MKQLFKYLEGDKTIWLMSIIFGLISIVTVYSFIPVLISYTGGSTEFHLFKHMLILGAGFVIMYYVHKVNFKYFSRLAQIMLWLSVVLLLLTLLFGASINGAKRWLMIPGINQGFQTSDFAKLALVMYVARMLVLNKDKLNNFKEGILPILIPIGVICMLILPQDFSTAGMLFGICMLLLFIGNVPYKFLLYIVGALVGMFLLVLLIGKAAPDLVPRAKTWTNRVEAFFGGDSASEEHPQVRQGKVAMANGGTFGVGVGQGTFKKTIPQAYADFYFASFVEENGLVGGISLIVFFLVLLYRVFKIAIRCEKSFGTYLVIGIGLSLIVQAFVNMMVPTGLVPVTGQNMPMLGLGGTSLWFTCVSLAIILSVSRTVYDNEEEDLDLDNELQTAEVDNNKYEVE